MKKLAVFVEGQTERIFSERFLIEIAGQNRIAIDWKRYHGGKKFSRMSIEVGATSLDGDEKYYALIFDCGADNRVVSEIRDQYDRLVQSGYSSIIGIRDVYPLSRRDIPKIEGSFRSLVKTNPIEALLVLSTMEIEAWFLSEYTHFERVHENLTVDRIAAHVGFDPRTINSENRPHPSADLGDIYGLVGLVYGKDKAFTQQIVDALDHARLYRELGKRLGSLQKFIGGIDNFLLG